MRNVIVTGGSRGLGLSIARRLVKAGYCVIAVARAQSDELSKSLDETEGDQVGAMRFEPFDLAELDKIPEFVKQLRQKFGPIYGLVNNAGVSTEGMLALTYTEQIELVVRMNTVSPLVLTRYVIRAMLGDGGGRVVNMSSITAFTGYSGLSVYAATKASLIGFTKSLAREVGRAGINVNAVAPGFVSTDMTKGLGPEQQQKIMRRSALNRMVEPGDVADAVEFLLGDGSKNITGTVLTVDAGNTA